MSEMRIATRTVPTNFGPMRGANGNARVTGPCGDTMEFWVRIEEWRLQAVTYTTDGCGSSILAGYAAAALVERATVDQALDLQQEYVLEFLGGLPEETRHCALLAANTLKSAIHEYLKQQQRNLLTPGRE